MPEGTLTEIVVNVGGPSGFGPLGPVGVGWASNPNNPGGSGGGGGGVGIGATLAASARQLAAVVPKITLAPPPPVIHVVDVVAANDAAFAAAADALGAIGTVSAGVLGVLIPGRLSDLPSPIPATLPEVTTYGSRLPEMDTARPVTAWTAVRNFLAPAIPFLPLQPSPISVPRAVPLPMPAPGQAPSRATQPQPQPEPQAEPQPRPQPQPEPARARYPAEPLAPPFGYYVPPTDLPPTPKPSQAPANRLTSLTRPQVGSVQLPVEQPVPKEDLNKDCKEMKKTQKKGKCRIGLFREQPNGDIKFTQWEESRCVDNTRKPYVKRRKRGPH